MITPSVLTIEVEPTISSYNRTEIDHVLSRPILPRYHSLRLGLWPSPDRFSTTSGPHTLSRHACRTGDSIMVWSKGKAWNGFRAALPGIALLLAVAVAGLGSVGSAFGQHTYYVSKSTGSDSSTPTQAQSKSTPWAHLPGMASCTSNCGSYTPTAGDTFILKGCDVWTNSDLPVLWNWSGTSGSPIKITVDQSWYNTTNCSSGWNRPVWDEQNTAVSPQVFFRAANSGNTDSVTLDNIEMTGGGGDSLSAVQCYNGCTNWTFSSLYLHAWHVVTDGSCRMFQGSTSMLGTIFTQNVIDGSDATGASPAGATCYATYPSLPPQFTNNVIHDLANGIVGAAGSGKSAVISGNTIYNIKESNAGSHPNAIEIVGTGTHYVYNNVIHDNVGESFMFGNTGEVDYVWNNVWYNILGNNPEAPQVPGQSNMTFSFWNNTIVPTSGGTCVQWNSGDGGGFTAVTIENTHCISTGSVANSSWNGTAATLNNNVLMSPTTAASQGYASSGTYAYSPTASTNGTVGAGKTICGAEETCRGNFAALANDTAYACMQRTVNGVVQAVCPARSAVPRPGDAGAYQYAAGGTQPNPPTGLTAQVQ